MQSVLARVRGFQTGYDFEQRKFARTIGDFPLDTFRSRDGQGDTEKKMPDAIGFGGVLQCDGRVLSRLQECMALAASNFGDGGAVPPETEGTSASGLDSGGPLSNVARNRQRS